MSERAAPFYCPYCGEESVRPFGDDPDAGHGQWTCDDCLRVFKLNYVGTTGRPAADGPATPGGVAS